MWRLASRCARPSAAPRLAPRRAPALAAATPRPAARESPLRRWSGLARSRFPPSAAPSRRHGAGVVEAVRHDASLRRQLLQRRALSALPGLGLHEEMADVASASPQDAALRLLDAAQHEALATNGSLENTAMTMYAAIEGSQPGIWTPVYGLQTLIDYIHETFHVPWYAAIVGTAVFLRVLLFPLYLMSLRNSGRMRYVAPQISAWSAEAQLRIQRGEAPQTVYPLMRARMKELYREHDVSAIRTFLPAFAQFPVFITVFMSMRSMSRRFSGLESGGALWFPNLVIPDPNYVLPFISAGMMLLSFEVMKQPGVNKMLSFIITWGFRFVTVIFIPIACNLQAGLVLYFVTNNTLTVLQGLLTKFAATRRILSIPDPPPPESTDKARDEVLHSRVLPQVPFSTRIELDFKKQQAQKDSGKGPKIKDKGGKGEPPRYSSPRQAQAQAEASTDAPSQTSSAASGNTKSEDK